MSYTTSDNNYGTAKLIVGTSGKANYLTIATALTAASSGDTIFILPGTYTENLTLKAGVNLTAWGCDSSLNGTGTVIISGTCTLTTAGSVTISGIQLQTNSAALLAVTGSVASVVNLNNCYLNCSNNTGITFSSSNAASIIDISNCTGNLGTTGIALFSQTSSGTLYINYSDFSNTGGSSTASTASAGILNFNYSIFTNPLTTSSTATSSINYCYFSNASQNVISLTIGGSGAQGVQYCQIFSGSASAITISSTLNIFTCDISSSNTNAITGAGTINYSNLVFFGSSATINSTLTQAISGTLQGSKNTAPTAGFLGERITNTGTAVATTSATSKTITSISLTAGIWDLTAMAYSQPTGGTLVMQQQVLSISTTDNTVEGTFADQKVVINQATLGAATGCVAAFRVVLTTTTTYYAVVNNIYTSTTCPTNARISAVRVG